MSMSYPNLFSALYYPFSRSINVASTKQMLLVFDSVYFLDPINDEEWRAHLFEEMEAAEDQRFEGYKTLYQSIPTLIKEKVIVPVDPGAVSSTQAVSTTAAALSDLLDSRWVEIASAPSRFRMPHRSLAEDGSPTWQAFLQKLPHDFVTALRTIPNLSPHLVREGSERSSWTLSYAAGSAAALNTHLAAADQLGVTLVTDSHMHHTLLLVKLARDVTPSDKPRPLSAAAVDKLAQRVAISLLEQLLPEEGLKEISFDDILSFRARTQDIRRQLITDIASRLSLLKEIHQPDELEQLTRQIAIALQKELKEYRAEMGAVRDKLWPELVSAMTASLPAGGMAAVAMTYLGSPGYAFAAPLAAAGLALLKSALGLRAEERKLQAKAAPAVSYLSLVQDKLS